MDTPNTSVIGTFDRPAGKLDILYRESTREADEQAARLDRLTVELQPVLVEAEALAVEIDALAAAHGQQVAAWRKIPFTKLLDRGAPSSQILWSQSALAELDNAFIQARVLRTLRQRPLADTLTLDKQGPENAVEVLRSRVQHARELPAFIRRKGEALEGWIADIVRWAETHPEGRR